ncbi:MAG: ImmA/IrrE family metallo-endopeptidase [Promethearchaeota archaeon]|nr:MAG: ImmA/IrrE family metallo-endopeptidase [Candidatus Lokiarchaeota archaeon]
MNQKSIAKVNPKLLKWARKQCGFTYEEAAGSYVNHKKLQKVEKGVDFLTFNQFINLANKYGRPPSFFYLDHIPKKALIKDFRTSSSQEVKYTPKLIKNIIKVKEKRNFAIEYKFYDKQYDYSYVDSITLNSNIIDVADQILELLKINLKIRLSWKDKYYALKEWIKAIERIGILVFQLSNINTEEMRAFSISEIPYPVIALNRGDSPFGRIFSLIHELCHIMLKEGGLCIYEHPNEEHYEIEKFCNAVAGEFLVPEKSLLNQSFILKHKTSEVWDNNELNKLSKIYWVSNEVILRRLLTLNYTTKDFYRKKITKKKTPPSVKTFGDYGYKKVLRTNSPNFIKIVLNAMYDREIPMTDVSYYLSMSLKYFNDLSDNFKI